MPNSHRSDVIKRGITRAPHRAFLRAMGLDDADIERPFVAVRCNVPAVFLYGGSALPGRIEDRDVTILDVYEGVGARLRGDLAPENLDRLERCAVPTVGSCPGQFTANTQDKGAETL